MKKLTTLLVTCILVLSLSGIALADGDGGVLHGPGSPVAAPPQETSSAPANTDELYYPTASDFTLLIVWLEQSIL